MQPSTIKTDFSFRREVLSGSTSMLTIGPLKLLVPQDMRRRRVYVGVLWQGFIDWTAEAELSFYRGGSPVESMKQRWGTQFPASGASSVGWGLGSQGWRMSVAGFPAFDVTTWTPPGNYPNGIPMGGDGDAITVQGVQRPDGVNLESARMVMYPMDYVGDLDEIRFQWTAYTPTTTDSSPTVEVYLGCKSFQ